MARDRLDAWSGFGVKMKRGDYPTDSATIRGEFVAHLLFSLDAIVYRAYVDFARTQGKSSTESTI